MRMLKEGKIVRTLDEGNGAAHSRAAKIEAKIIAAAAELLKDEDESMGTLIEGALADSTKRMREISAEASKSIEEAIDRVLEAVKADRKDDSGLKDLLDELKDAQKVAHRDLGEQIDELAKAVEAIKAPEEKERPRKWKSTITARNSDGMASEVETVVVE